jgi:hypothetical protein
MSESSFPPPHATQELVDRLLVQTIAVNENVGTLINQNDAIVRRQNVLVTLFIVALTLLCAQLALGLSQQRLQEATRLTLAVAEAGRTQVQADLALAKNQVEDLRKMVGGMRQQLQSVPTVTSDSAGRINLEVAVSDAQKSGPDPAGTSPSAKVSLGNRLVIPLKPSQSRLSNGQ